MSLIVEHLRFLVRGGTAANLAAVNEVPLQRELVVERDTLKMKLGDGATHFNDLPYIGDARPGQIGFGVSNGSDPLSSGVKRVIRLIDETTIIGWSLSADAVGDASVDLWASTTFPPVVGDKITGTSPPTLVGQQIASGGVPGWSATLPAGAWLAFNVMPLATVSRLDLTLQTIRNG